MALVSIFYIIKKEVQNFFFTSPPWYQVSPCEPIHVDTDEDDNSETLKILTTTHNK